MKDKLLRVEDETSPISEEEWARLKTLTDKTPKNKIFFYGSPTRTSNFFYEEYINRKRKEGKS